jgi:hypothetical protein
VPALLPDDLLGERSVQTPDDVEATGPQVGKEQSKAHLLLHGVAAVIHDQVEVRAGAREQQVKAAAARLVALVDLDTRRRYKGNFRDIKAMDGRRGR